MPTHGEADEPSVGLLPQDIEIGQGLIVKGGSDISIVACGTMVEPALEASKILEKNGISARVIDMYTIKPLDEKLVIKCARETNAMITAEEHSIIGGLGAAVAEVIAENNLSTKFVRMGIKDIFCESGEPADLLEKYELNEKHIVKTAKSLIDS